MILAGIFSNSADIIFFSAIAAIIVLVIILFIVTKIVQSKKDKQYAAAYQEKKRQEALASQTESPKEETVSATEETPVVEEEPVVEETPVVEEEPVVEETPVVKEAPQKAAVKKTTTPAKAKAAAAKPVTPAKPKPAPAKKPAASAEPKGRTYNGKYEVYPNADGYQYRLKASNGEVLIVSETYSSKDSVLKAIDAVQRNIETGEIRIIEDKHGMFKFKLTSKNYRVIALGSNYSTEKSAIRASESFKKFAVKADIIEIEYATESDATATPVEVGTVEDKTGGKYIIEKFNGEFSWDLKASNGQILCQAEGYTSKTGVMNSIESFKKNVETGTFKITRDKNDNFHYKLYSASGRVAAIGESYSTKQLAESAVNSVVGYYKNSEIVENKETKTK